MLKISRKSDISKYYIHNDLAEREIKFLIERWLKKAGHPLISRWGEISKAYLPFWRITGTAFSIEERPGGALFDTSGFHGNYVNDSPATEVKITPKDITFCANEGFNWGIDSLGIRTQVVKLTPIDKDFDDANHLVPLTMTSEQAEQRFDETVFSIATAVAKAGSNLDIITVGLEKMLIYFPVWIANFIDATGKHTAQFDPLAKRVVSIVDGEMEPLPADTPSCDDLSSIRITPHRCPNCGEDLPDSERSLAYYCNNCQRLFQEQGLTYKELKVRVPSNFDNECKLLPFWVFDLSASDGSEKPKLLKALSLVRFSTEYFYIPAFDLVNASKLLRLINHYNKFHDGFAFKELPTGRYGFTDVILSPEIAAALIAPLTTATKAAKGYKSYEAPIGEEVEYAAPELIWLPYTLDRYFWREQITGAAIEKAAVNI